MIPDQRGADHQIRSLHSVTQCISQPGDDDDDDYYRGAVSSSVLDIAVVYLSLLSHVNPYHTHIRLSSPTLWSSPCASLEEHSIIHLTTDR